MKCSALVTDLVPIVGAANVLIGDDVRARSVAWGRDEPCLAKAIVRPGSTDEVAAIATLCTRTGQTMVVHGGRTGLALGAAAGPMDIVISLERMNRIHAISRDDRTAILEAGVIVQSLQDAAAAAGLAFPVDFGARGSATIGGAISTNAGGNRVLRFGMMRDQVLGLEVVLSSGAVVSDLKGLMKDNTGYDLKQLFIGAEGTLGIVTRAVLRLRPRLPSRNTALIAADSFPDVLRLLPLLESKLGGQLSAFEVMWREFYDVVAVNARGGLPIATGSACYVLVEAEGGDQTSDEAAFKNALEGAMQTALCADAVIAKSEDERNQLWALRDDIDSLFALGDHIEFDISLPASRMEEYVAGVRHAVAAACPGTRCIVFGHIADGNLHIVASTLGRFSAADQLAVKHAVYALVTTMRGSVSAEHGIGLEKKPYLAYSRSAPELALMRTLKLALDPDNLLNPGKILDLPAASR